MNRIRSTQSAWLFFSLISLFLFLGGHAPADQVVNSALDDGPGSLRNAIRVATAGETITFDAVMSGMTIRLQGSHLTIDKDLTIDGSSLDVPVTINGDKDDDGPTNDDSRIFLVEAGVTVVLDSLVMTKGHKPFPYTGMTRIEDAEYFGGGAIFNRGTLTVRDSTLTYNRAGDAGKNVGPSGQGGAIYNAAGTLVIERCQINFNRAGDGAAELNAEFQRDFGDGGDGGAIYNRSGDVSIHDSTLDGNRAGNGDGPGSFASNETSNTEGGHGGAIHHFEGSLRIVNSTLSNNRAGDGSRVGNSIPPYGGLGGAILTVSSSNPSTLIVINSTLTGNRAGDGGLYQNGLWGARGGDGGAISTFGGPTVCVNCTITDNRAGDGGFNVDPMVVFERGGDGGDGGGIAGGEAVHCTITGNTAGVGTNGTLSSGRNGNGGGVDEYTFVSNSIVSGNNAGVGSLQGPGMGPDVFNFGFASPFTGPNLIGDNETVEAFVPLQLPLVGDVDNPAVPDLGPLQANGGPTDTRLPKDGSPVINAGNAAMRPMDRADIDGDNNTTEMIPVPTDQRGSARVAGTAPDLGAVELQNVPPAVAAVADQALRTALAARIAKFVRLAKKAQRKRQVTKSKRLKKKVRRLRKRMRNL